MQQKQPGYVLRFKAKPGKGDELFQVCNDLHFNGDPDGPVDWVLSRSVEDPDTLWAFEFYRDDASFDRHYSDPALDEGHQKVMDLLAEHVEEWGVREHVRIESSS
ncbi:putative quinol monooxygenase [Curtobacterium sp. VKM Ac-2887]|uniref:putative quinol monooxygenase n=1 Tax=Curtobacterium sp. VKM Ac-2887 TaxID=2783819 RepID=UPI00188A5B4A|nr:antibiotic biosynthesis monooxygenase [Curtobacterium sp. VKM Ac-2887]MBF4588287.1 antibiotic biosynthesis monooxygenase [Curtobacterium sp. VKM Ac-2887]